MPSTALSLRTTGCYCWMPLDAGDAVSICLQLCSRSVLPFYWVSEPTGRYTANCSSLAPRSRSEGRRCWLQKDSSHLTAAHGFQKTPTARASTAVCSMVLEIYHSSVLKLSSLPKSWLRLRTAHVLRCPPANVPTTEIGQLKMWDFWSLTGAVVAPPSGRNVSTQILGAPLWQCNSGIPSGRWR